MPTTLSERVLVAVLYNYHFTSSPRYAVFYLPAWVMILYGIYGLRHC